MSKERDYEVLPEDFSAVDYCFKVVIIGDSGVGKSCLSLKATQNVFDSSCQTTVGVEFFTLNLMYKEKSIKMQIWDTCGQEVYRSLITSYYKNASLAILVYAINDENSFKNLDGWIKELKENASPDTKMILIGNKVDLEDFRQVTKEQGQQFQKDYQMDMFLEASAKSGLNALEMFALGAKLLYHEAEELNEKSNKKEIHLDPKSRLILGGSFIGTSKKGCC